MKLNPGVEFNIDRKKYVGELPDELVERLTQGMEKKQKEAWIKKYKFVAEKPKKEEIPADK